MTENLNDVWRNVGRRILFFTSETHEKIPAQTGIYAWFYPLRIHSKNPYDFVTEINKILFYDSSKEGAPERRIDIDFNWDRIRLILQKSYLERDSSPSLLDGWRRVMRNPHAADVLKRTIMECSILMPPLYVGRTDNLYQRYLQHVRGGGRNSNFHKRFIEFSSKADIVSRVSELLFVCIVTSDEDIEGSIGSDLSVVIEGIMKLLCKPTYGKR